MFLMAVRSKPIIKVLTLSILMWFPSQELFPSTMVLGLGELQNKNEALTRIQKEILNDSFGELGIKLEYRVAPLGRILIEMDNGTIDGNAGRSSLIEKDAKNIVRVPEAIFSFKTFQITKKSKGKLPTGTGKLSAAVYLGDSSTKAIAKDDRIIETRNIDHITRLVKTSRVDYGLIGVADIKAYPQILKDFHVAAVGPELKLYVYLNQKHEKYTSPLAQKLKEFKKGSKLKALYKKEGLLKLYELIYPIASR